MTDIEICPLKAKYIDGIIAINNMCFSTPWSRESLEKEIEDNIIAKYVVAKKCDILMGYAGMWHILDEGHITNIAVHPEYRGIGVGSLLLDALIEICRIESINSMTLEVRKSNIIAQNLYKKYGFIEEGIRRFYYANNKEDAIIMWKYNI
ncbi:ribosomal protein S18-alanine N-acetyltransferase [uncultured Clostridium sp.]|uniref:ribosomal protein S18-alanine N-acetyltransferase n=1 Tax=uncultured Clostridium sp. TaxID=59620 RepID=UPI0025CC8F92|nr:ribosomal protein S18-alanine N-acetyltransferase [uncultured Clostridium sp.]